MTDPIKALIAAVDNLLRSGPSEVSDARRNLGFAVAAAKAAAEGRPEPQLLGTETKLREPRAGWAVVAMRVGANTLWRECPIADIAKDAAECAAVMMRRHGEAHPEPAPTAPSRWDYVQGACYCRVCKQEADECECEPARPEPAAEPSRISHFRIMLDNARAAATSGNPGAMLAICDAVEALAREVRK